MPEGEKSARANTVRPNGAEIKRRRVEMGWEQEDLANKVKYSVSSVKRHEAGGPCQVATLAAYAKVFGLVDDIRPLLAASLNEGEGLASATADASGGQSGTITDGEELLRGLTDVVRDRLEKAAQEIIAELRAELALVRLAEKRSGSVEIEFAGPPRALQLFQEAYEAGAFAHLGVKSLEIVYVPKPTEAETIAEDAARYESALADAEEALAILTHHVAALRTEVKRARENRKIYSRVAWGLGEIATLLGRLTQRTRFAARECEETAMVFASESALDYTTIRRPPANAPWLWMTRPQPKPPEDAAPPPE